MGLFSASEANAETGVPSKRKAIAWRLMKLTNAIKIELASFVRHSNVIVCNYLLCVLEF